MIENFVFFFTFKSLCEIRKSYSFNVSRIREKRRSKPLGKFATCTKASKIYDRKYSFLPKINVRRIEQQRELNSNLFHYCLMKQFVVQIALVLIALQI